MQRPRVFWLHFNRLNVRAGDPDVWTVHMSDRCIQTPLAECRVSVTTVYKGPAARQPRAYLRGRGRVFVYKDYVVIVP